MKVFSWIARLVAAAIMLQTLYFKFTGAEESVYIFTQVGMEPFGRYASGVAELIASTLLFVPGLIGLGALIGLGTMSGAIFFHLTTLGIDVKGDGGLLFSLALLTFTCCLFLAIRYRNQIPVLNRIIA